MAVVLLSACSSDEQSPEQPAGGLPASGQTWTVTGQGMLPSEALTRAVSVGGATGSKIFGNWEDGDKIYALDGVNDAGTLTTTIDAGNSALADFEGTLTFSSTPVAGVTTLDYYTPSATLDYTVQNGQLSTISSSCFYMHATPKVKTVDTPMKAINMEGAAFKPMQTLVVLKFKEIAGGTWLRPEHVKVTSANGALVLQENMKTGVKTLGDLEFDCAQRDGMYPYEVYLVLRNTGTSDTYHFQVTVGSDTYETVTDSSDETQKDFSWNYDASNDNWILSRTLGVKLVPVSSTNTITGWGDGGTTTESITE